MFIVRAARAAKTAENPKLYPKYRLEQWLLEADVVAVNSASDYKKFMQSTKFILKELDANEKLRLRICLRAIFVKRDRLSYLDPDMTHRPRDLDSDFNCPEIPDFEKRQGTLGNR